jgi:hypothetical protein
MGKEDKPKKKKRKRYSKESTHYIDGEELRNELRAYRKSGEISIKLYDMFRLFTQRVSGMPNFANYHYRDAFEADAFLRLIQQVHMIDPEQNPFSYITTLIVNSNKARIKLEHKQQRIKAALQEEVWSDFESSSADVQYAKNNGND